ncbi:MAG: class I SAM-dependent methyltransferase [Rhodospirillales bacterium]|nr:class I SAM-dependent methyltransferase [Rhodospirillales bacterium]
MARQTIVFDDRLFDYIRSVSLRQPDVLARLRDETQRFPQANMLLTPEQGQFLGLLVEMMDARRIIEIGTFTGYSALWMALALPEDGRLICCDIDEKSTAVARRFWAEAGVAGKIDLRMALALDTLESLITAGGGTSAFDLVFIDADKSNYLAYYEKALVLLRPGGLIAIDNVLWGGEVADPTIRDDKTVAVLRDFNARLHADSRVSLSLVPIGDGLTLARKRA